MSGFAGTEGTSLERQAQGIQLMEALGRLHPYGQEILIMSPGIADHPHVICFAAVKQNFELNRIDTEIIRVQREIALIELQQRRDLLRSQGFGYPRPDH